MLLRQVRVEYRHVTRSRPQAASAWEAAPHKVDEGEPDEGADGQQRGGPQLRTEDELPVDFPEAPLLVSMAALLCELLYQLGDPATEARNV